MANAINVAINVTGNASPQVKKVTMNLKEMGEKVSQVGMRMGAAFTLPLVGLAALVGQSKEVQAALKPVTDEFTKIGAQVGLAFLPVIKEAVPLVLQLANGIKGVVDWYAKLEPGQQKIIIGVGLFVAAIGPMVAIVGQVVSTVGLLTELMPVLAVGMGAAVAPILAVAAALTSLYALVNMTEFKQVLAMSEGGWATIFGGKAAGEKAFIASAQRQGLIGKPKAAGGPVSAGVAYPVGEMGPEMFVPGQSGSIIPNNRMGGTTIIINVDGRSTINTSSPEQMRQVATLVGPAIDQYYRSRTGRG